MSIFDRLYPPRTMQKVSTENVVEKDSFALFESGKKTASLFDLNDNTVILHGYNTNPHVYSVVNKLSTLAASIPLKVQKVVNEKSLFKYKHLTWEDKIRPKGLRMKEDSLEDIPNHRLQELLEYPNKQDGPYEFRFNFFVNKFVTGNAFIEAIRPTESRPPTEVWNLPPLGVSINRSGNFYDKILEIYFSWSQTQKTIPKELILHSKYYNPDGNVWGLSPLSAARRAVQLINEGEEWNVALIQNGAKPEYVIIMPNGTTDEQKRKVQNDFMDRYGGKNKVSKPIVAEADAVKFEALGYNVKDMDWANSQLSSMRKVYDVYNVSSEIGNDPENKTMANKREAKRSVYVDKILPEVESFRDELNRWLTPMYGEENIQIELDLTGVEALNEEKDKVAERMNTAWWLTPNEKRAEMDYEAIGDPTFEEPWISMNQLPLSEILFTPEVTEEEVKATLKEYSVNGN